MTVEILLFGAAAAAVKAERLPVTLPAAATVRDALEALAIQHPALRQLLQSARLAVNHAFARPETPIRPGDEVALISLVGGG